MRPGLVQRVNTADFGSYVRDTGFHNLSVRLTSDDPGQAGGDGITGAPLSVAQLAASGNNLYPTTLQPPVAFGERSGVHGAVKTPGLRNVELTAPFFHNGGEESLTDVVTFYSRGGNFFNQNLADVDRQLQPRNFNLNDTQALVAFLQALTDERVRNQLHADSCNWIWGRRSLPEVLPILNQRERSLLPVAKRGRPVSSY